MVQLLQIVVYRYTGPDCSPVRLASATDVNSFSYFTRNSIKEHLNFATRVICQRAPPGSRQSVGLKDTPYFCHMYLRLDGLCVCVVTDKEYNLRVAFSLISKIVSDWDKATLGKWKEISTDQEYSPDSMNNDMRVYQDPNQADKLTRIQKNLDEIKDIMHKNIDDVLKRGETIDTLMEKSQDLSTVSRQFYKKAQKTNQCCKAY